jgi:hypothetical protein
MTTVLTGLAAVYAAAGLSMDAKDSVSRDALSSAITAALAEGEKVGLQKAGNDATKIGADATAAANVRAKTILCHAEAKGREGMAQHLAFDSNMAADAAVAMLKAAPKGQSQSRLDGSVPDPKLAADENSGQQMDAAATGAAWDTVMTKRGMKIAS